MPRGRGRPINMITPRGISRRRTLALMGAGAALAGCAPRDPSVLTGADVHRAGFPTVDAVKWMGAEIERGTSGRLKLQQFPSAQLGSEDDSLGLAQFGAVDFARVNFAACNAIVPGTRVLCLPFVIESIEHLHRAVDSVVGERILASFDRAGLVGLAIYDAGARCFYNTRRPIVRPDDLRGLKIRSPMSDVFLRALNAMGANATPLSVSGVFQALSTHLIDGAENNWPTYETARHLEMAPYWSNTRHSYSPEVLTMSRRRFDALSRDDQELVREAAMRSVAVMREHWARFDAESRDKALAAGVKENDVDRAAFRVAVSDMLKRETDEPALADLLRRVRDLSG